MLYYAIWLFAQIVLESFPISSSGHMLLLDKLLAAVHIAPSVNNAAQGNIFESVDVLEHFAHGATIGMVALFFFSRWAFLLRNVKRCWRIIAKIIALGFIADLCTSIFYVFFHFSSVQNYFPVGLGFFITGILLLSLRWCPTKATGTFNWRSATILGVVQGCALLPGISRLASTFVVARWLGIAPRKSFEISWLIVMPLLCAAFLNSVRLMVMEHQASYLLSIPLLATMGIAMVVAYFCLCLVSRLAYSNRLWWFGVYMIGLFLLSLLFCMHCY